MSAEETLKKHWTKWVQKVYGDESIDEQSFEELDKEMFLDAMEEHAQASVEQFKKELRKELQLQCSQIPISRGVEIGVYEKILSLSLLEPKKP